MLQPAGGEVCPSVLTAPFSLGRDIVGNAVCCANFQNPPWQEHRCRPLVGQVLEVRAHQLDSQTPSGLAFMAAVLFASSGLFWFSEGVCQIYASGRLKSADTTPLEAWRDGQFWLPSCT